MNKYIKHIWSGLSELKKVVNLLGTQNNQIEELNSSISIFKERLSVLEDLYEEKKIHNYTLTSMFHALENISDKSVCIDCGAHKGLVSEVFLRFGAEVHAFEPNPYLCNYIRFRLSNFVSQKKLIIHNKAVWDREEKTRLFFRNNYSPNKDFLNESSESSSIIFEKTDSNSILNTDINNFLDVESIDIIQYINKLPEVHLMKIDIEGAEFDVLEKLIITEVYKKIKYIYVETHDQKIPALSQKASTLKQLIKDKNIYNIYLEWH